MNHPLNTILYGPPGTGKTYATFRRCVEICDQRPVSDLTPERIRSRYDELVDKERVEFVTFHQSYGYEEFVQGLRPETEEGGGFRLVVCDGVLKRVAERARAAPVPDLGKRRFFKVSLDSEEGEVFKECMEDGCMRFDGHSDQDWSDHRYNTYDAVKTRIKELYPDHPEAPRWWSSVGVGHFRGSMQLGDIVVVPEGTWEYQAVGEVNGGYEYDPMGDSARWAHRRPVRWHWKAEGESRPITDFQKHGFAKLPVFEIDPDTPGSLLKHLGQDPNPLPYVLVIDEINRANVAKVLGELITLLEEDKGEGAKNEIAVTLPHSGKPFTLPANLHVLGTMNTADRSIALLDTALRRRFTFEEIAPDRSRLEEAGRSAGIDLPDVLRAMNDRLEWLVDRDHLIGHAWFLDAKSKKAVDEVMRRKVIPLIAEYFYDDWEKVRAVLGGTEAFVKRQELNSPPGLDGGGETRYRWTVRKNFPDDAYKELIAGGKN